MTYGLIIINNNNLYSQQYFSHLRLKLQKILGLALKFSSWIFFYTQVHIYSKVIKWKHKNYVGYVGVELFEVFPEFERKKF